MPKWRMRVPTNKNEATNMKTTTVGIDLAKNIFQVHGVYEHSKKVFNRQIRRNQMIAFFTQ
nr:hypothetical protein [Bacteroidota bacterium]